MRIGVPKEIKVHEYRVGLVPAAARELVESGHEVLVQTGAAAGIGFTDADYQRVGAKIAATAADVFAKSEMIVKVKEPQPVECAMLRKGQVLYTYLHLAPDPKQTEALIKSGATCIAYETVTAPDGSLPLLTPMSEVAGRLSVQAGARCLEAPVGGPGILLGGVSGVKPAEVVILGAGVAGSNACQIAVGMGAHVTVIDINPARLRYLHDIMGGRVTTLMSNRANIEGEVCRADLVIGSVLVPGARAPHLVTRGMVRRMRRNSVIVDIAIDQGGCAETSRPTTHAEPTFRVHDVIHYCVANMPGAVPRTSTYALTNATLGYGLKLADRGFARAVAADAALRLGVNVHNGGVTHGAVAAALGMECAEI